MHVLDLTPLKASASAFLTPEGVFLVVFTYLEVTAV